MKAYSTRDFEALMPRGGGVIGSSSVGASGPSPRSSSPPLKRKGMLILLHPLLSLGIFHLGNTLFSLEQ